MSAVLRPLKFNGTTDRAIKHLFLALISRYGKVPEEILKKIGEVVACDQITLNPTFNAGMPPSKVEEYAIVPRRSSKSILPYMNLGTLTLEWVASEGFTRINVLPDPPFHESLSQLWRWLRERLNEQALLVGAEEEGHEPKQEPEWWPKKADTRSKYREDWKRIKSQLKKGHSLEDIAAQMGTHTSHISRIKRFGESWEKIYHTA